MTPQQDQSPNVETLPLTTELTDDLLLPPSAVVFTGQARPAMVPMYQHNVEITGAGQAAWAALHVTPVTTGQG